MARNIKEEDISSYCGAWITIGSFDGIHKGHQRIINKLIQGARNFGQRAVVITFYPNPAEVLGKKEPPFYLTTPEEKDRILQEMGVDSILTLRFDKELSRMTAREFITMLHEQIHFSCLMIGYDFRLGAEREGDIHELREIGECLGYCVRAAEAVEKGKSPVSSTRIRDLLLEGKVEKAAKHLGRFYEISGEVIHGYGRGKHIGFPTANIMPWIKKIIPAASVYAVFAELDGELLPGVINIGYRPTFYKKPVERTIELHIMDFSRDIYGKELRILFVKCIRTEKKFESAKVLMKEIHHDIKVAKKALSDASTKKNLPA